MNRKNRCPYCGKRITYWERFSCRRKAEYVCPRCGKESRVTINKMVILAFIICAIIAAMIMTAWIFLDLVSNPIGVAAVAIPLIIFGLISPNFVKYEPLKKYQKSMEAKRAGIEYSDNLTMSELDDDYGSSFSDGTGQFQINSDVFNQIKADRNAMRRQSSGEDLVSDSGELNAGNNKPYVEVAGNVRENHAVSDMPLKKLHSEGTRINRSRHYIDAPSSSESYPTQYADAHDSQSRPVRSERPETNRYSANRRF